MEKNNNLPLAEVLHDLIRINNDRAAGYQKAVDELNIADVDLRTVFQRMADQSAYFINELSSAISKLNESPALSIPMPGKIYRVWTDVKSAFAGNNRIALLESCEFGEDAAQKAYDDALASAAEMDTNTRQLIAAQKIALKNSHDEIRKMRDMQVVSE